MSKLREELIKLQEDEKETEEHELKAARERQKAINDLEKGVRNFKYFCLHIFIILILKENKCSFSNMYFKKKQV